MKEKIFGSSEARRLVPQRKKDANKSHGGRSLIIAGSRGMYGAAILAATASARVGSGYTFLAITDKKYFPTHRHPDFLIEEAKKINKNLIKESSIAIGPGLGRSLRTLQLLKKLKSLKAQKVLVDADALNVAAASRGFKFPSTWVLTPHEGELGRLLKISPKKIHQRREFYAEKAQKKFGCTFVLKGFHTLVAHSKGIYRIDAGNAALSKAGTGDVLTGMIVGFLAQGLPPVDAACLACFVHGALADRWIKNRKDPLSLMASDLLEELPGELFRLRRA